MYGHPEYMQSYCQAWKASQRDKRKKLIKKYVLYPLAFVAFLSVGVVF